MTPVQIGYFKHFMYDSGIARQYIITYNKHHYGANPHSVEEWLQKAAVRQVIMDAFAFQLNHAYGYDYWKGVDEKWYEYWKMHENNFSNINYVFLKGTFAILRQNWDSPKYFEKETKSATYKRMNMRPPDGFIPDEEHEVTRQDLPIREAAEVSEIPERPAAATVPDGSPSGESDPLADFDFFDEERPQFLRLLENEISLNFNNGAFKITFNMPVSKEIVKTGMKHARLAKAKAGDICIILNRTQGARVSRSSSSNGLRFNITINSKDICTKLRTLLNVRSDYSVLNITRLPSTTDYIIFKITKQ